MNDEDIRGAVCFMEDNHAQGRTSINAGTVPQILFILQKENTEHGIEKGGENKANVVLGLFVLVLLSML